MTNPYPPISTDIVDIPVEGMFASSDWRVICREGENYYLSCGGLVYEKPEGGATHCIKPKFHRTWECEDFEGRTKERDFRGVVDIDWKIREEARKALIRTGLDNEQVYNALNSLMYSNIRLEK